MIYFSLCPVLRNAAAFQTFDPACEVNLAGGIYVAFMLTTRRGIIVFIAHVTILDATAAYPNHIGHSVCLRNSMLFPYVDRLRFSY